MANVFYVGSGDLTALNEALQCAGPHVKALYVLLLSKEECCASCKLVEKNVTDIFVLTLCSEASLHLSLF